MGSHIKRNFLNSCVKTPIDPCNNCPAPNYNRPKVYLGRLTSKTSTRKVTENAIPFWHSPGIRPLAKFYESIPDYSDINHLPKDEFYSTLDSLRSTYEELKSKPVLQEENNNSSSNSFATTCKAKKSAKKKNGTKKKSTNNKKSKSENKTLKVKEDTNCCTSSPSDGFLEVPQMTRLSSRCKLDFRKEVDDFKKTLINYEDELRNHANKTLKDKEVTNCFTSSPSDGFLEVPQMTRLSSRCKLDFRKEVDDFKKTLINYEDELRNRAWSRCLERTKSSSFLSKLDSPPTKKVDENTQTEPTCLTPKPMTPSCSKTPLRKSFSSNDIDSISDIEKINLHSRKIASYKPVDELIKLEKPSVKDRTRLSTYYFEKPMKNPSPRTNELPKITIQSPASEITTSNTTTERTPKASPKKDKQNKKKRTSQTKSPLNMFGFEWNSSKKENVETPSPVHPVARPNLAATLRAVVSKKKVKELKNNCTYHDSTPQIDWEVRKTPAWRLLSLNESHEEILRLRLATRRAEQALQQRDYEMHMELMKQRVKSAPLLLEGSTYWGPNVGKLSHNCQSEGTQHTCEGLKRKQRRKNVNAEHDHHQFSFHNQNRLNEIQKIYGCTGKTSSQSRSSQRSGKSTQRRRKEKKCSTTQQSQQDFLRPPTLQESSRFGGGFESGDDLCSVDRAFL